MSKKAYVMSGISGSGKTTYARKLREEAGHQAAICSADFFFEARDGSGYKFDASKLGEAHAQCMRMFIVYCQEGRPVVICDNTGLQTWELSPYVLVARALGYDVEIITMECSPEVGTERNSHGLDAKASSRQSKKLASRFLPSDWKNTVVKAT